MTRAALLRIYDAHQLKPIFANKENDKENEDIDFTAKSIMSGNMLNYESELDAEMERFNIGSVVVALFAGYLIDSAWSHEPAYYFSTWAAYICIQGQLLGAIACVLTTLMLVHASFTLKRALAQRISIDPDPTRLHQIATINKRQITQLL